ncbi:hypothetical protein [Nonomuraea diastatica]|uniref:Uncharacterized protein n=1 Tax=Nonomuraea diastatica TaxID=1848329 RepID=A0A4R4WDX4_9ACTN|nr:hypothetical protein [Nonomuraea diastatica]TDD15437.1 hypothetical protein E1294_34410 [Nonomuraea diastatica]
MDEDHGSSERFTVSIGLHETSSWRARLANSMASPAGLLHRQVEDAWETTQGMTSIRTRSPVSRAELNGLP